jgi:hypothetical protein
MISDSFNSKVWIGTLDKSIYIADVLTRTFNKKIESHTDIIVSINYFINTKYL